MKISDYEKRAAVDGAITVLVVGLVLIGTLLALVLLYIGFRNGMWQ